MFQTFENSNFEHCLEFRISDLEFPSVGGLGVEANALSRPPGKYGRKIKTQRNWRGPAQAVEHVV